MATPKAEELKLDISELKKFLSMAQRQRSKDMLSLEIKKLEEKHLIEMSNAPRTEKASNSQSVSTTPKCYEVKITNPGWDEDDSFVYLYVTLTNVQTVPKDSITCTFTNCSVHLRVSGLDNKNHDLLINNLCAAIIPDKCSFKIKRNMIVVKLTKLNKVIWSCLTEVEKRMKDSKNYMPENDTNEDPSTNLISLMKKMYQDGDDNMKKMIAKAWTESQDKRNQELDSLP